MSVSHTENPRKLFRIKGDWELTARDPSRLDSGSGGVELHSLMLGQLEESEYGLSIIE